MRRGDDHPGDERAHPATRGDVERLTFLVGLGVLFLNDKLDRIINQEDHEMTTIDELSASLDAQKATLDTLTTLEAAEAAGGLQPGQVAVDQATIDAAAQKVADNQAAIDALVAADQTAQPAPPADGPPPAPQP